MKIINPLFRQDLYLYHYTRAETALDHILRNGTLRLGSFRDVNDPREAKEWDISPLIRADIAPSLDDYDALSREISALLKANARIVCFSEDQDEAVGQWQPEALLRRGFAKPSMWHHYGERSCGVCLMFNRDKLDAAFRDALDPSRLVTGKVRYTDARILVRPGASPFSVDLLKARDLDSYLQAIQGHLVKWLDQLFLTKLTDWQHEAEYRWVYWDDHAFPIYVSFGDALEAILVGDSFDEGTYGEVQKYCVKYRADLAACRTEVAGPRV